MQYFVKQRASETGDITIHTPAVDVGGMPLVSFELIVYSIAGGGTITITMESSNDLEA